MSRVEYLKKIRNWLVKEDNKGQKNGLCFAAFFNFEKKHNKWFLLELKKEAKTFDNWYDRWGNKHIIGTEFTYYWPLKDIAPRLEFLDKLIKKENGKTEL